MLTSILTALALGLMPAVDQDPPISTAPVSDWHPFSRSATTAYLADAAQIVPTGGGTRVRVARVPLTGRDFRHEVDTFAFRCSSREIRFIATDTYDGAGQLTERYEETVEEWDRVNEGTNYGFLYEVVCNEKRSAQGSYPSVTAFIGQTRN
ncbi:MAG: hypothetical protein Q8S53_11045 [Brevundimonas sp.]|uniref:surface-adhesin E family protein n=1 Tax=Brevundimonas sp. TaxID=1871086 RepID=UPI00273359E5|nr:surface-adhesin E family protein [Brevundimonas sp.]MDP3378891.1 hypothetical protein [Brevundimonas sp.]